jgi:hypothetical protein
MPMKDKEKTEGSGTAGVYLQLVIIRKHHEKVSSFFRETDFINKR